MIIGDTEIEKHKLHRYKSPILNDVDIDSILTSDKISSGEKNYKYFVINK